MEGNRHGEKWRIEYCDMKQHGVVEHVDVLNVRQAVRLATMLQASEQVTMINVFLLTPKRKEGSHVFDFKKEQDERQEGDK